MITGLEIANIRARYDIYGYRITATALPRKEEVFWQHLSNGLDRLDAEMHKIRRAFGTRGNSRRALLHLHSSIPEPCWGVRIKEEFKR